MTVSRKPLSNVPLELLKIYSADILDNDLLELKRILAQYFAKKAIANAANVWKEKGLTDTIQVIQALWELPNMKPVHIHYQFNLIYSDPDDTKFVDCTIASNADYLVSNDKHLNILKKIPFPKIILYLKSFLLFEHK